MRFGLFVPQGWRHDLVGIDPAKQWEAMLGVARLAEDLRFESVWVYDHFHTVPVPSEEATHEAWTLMAALRRRDQPRPARPDVHLHGLPEPDVPGEGRGDRGRRERRPHRDGHRRRLVRARVERLRLRLPHRRRPHRDAGRRRGDHEAGVDERGGDVRRRALPGGRRHLPSRCRCSPAGSRSGSRAAASGRRCAWPRSTPTTRTSRARWRASGTSREVLADHCRDLGRDFDAITRVGELQRGSSAGIEAELADRLRSVRGPAAALSLRRGPGVDGAAVHHRAARRGRRSRSSSGSRPCRTPA